MPDSPTEAVAPEALSHWHVLILCLSIYVLGAMLAETLLQVSSRTAYLLAVVDDVICLFFLADFVHQLVTARSKWGYLKWGWLDLISSIPNVPFLRIGRLARVVRILRILRGARSARLIVSTIYANRATGSLLAVFATAAAVMVAAAVAILNLETAPDSNIRTLADAFWWAFVTITTVGYGDRYPVTPEGRIVAVLLMIVGVGLFGTFTAYIASRFVGADQRQEDAIRKLGDEVRTMHRTLDEMRGQGQLPPEQSPDDDKPAPP